MAADMFLKISPVPVDLAGLSLAEARRLDSRPGRVNHWHPSSVRPR
jgi:hypothetical protein